MMAELPAPRRVLVVEDEPMVAEVVERYLRRDGYEVKMAGDGLEALRLFQGWVPDLVILDLMLPQMDGLEVCRRMRAASETPIIMLTARATSRTACWPGSGRRRLRDQTLQPRELAARARAVLRRSTGAGASGATPSGSGTSW
jgi:DNA-binding response OmpR family regulator